MIHLIAGYMQSIANPCSDDVFCRRHGRWVWENRGVLIQVRKSRAKGLKCCVCQKNGKKRYRSRGEK